MSDLELSDLDLGWLAGFYEGEGCCIFQGRRAGTGAHFRVDFVQKDLEPLYRVRDLLGLRGSLHADRKGHLLIHRLVYCGAEARSILLLLRPHLSERRQAQIQQALDRWNGRPLRGRGTTNSPGQLRLLG